MPRKQIDFSEEFIVRAKLALKLARARGEFTGDINAFLNKELAKQEQGIMQQAGWPTMQSSPSIVPNSAVSKPVVTPSPSPSPSPSPARAAPITSGFGISADLLNKLRRGIAELKEMRLVPETPKSFDGIVHNDRGPIVPAKLWRDLVAEIVNNSNKSGNNIPNNMLDFLGEKTSFAEYGQAVMLTYPSESGPGSARYFENICRRFNVACPVISIPPDEMLH